MAKMTIQQIRGLNDLIQDAVDAGVQETAQIHQAIARQPYALLEKIPVVAAPVRTIRRVQEAITDGVYQTIRTLNRTAGILATQVIDYLEERENRCEHS